MQEMKDSGIEWIGKIPLYWDITKVKYITSYSGSGGTPTSGNQDFYDNNLKYPWITISDMSEVDEINFSRDSISELGRKSKNLKVYPKGTLLYAMYASVGKTAILNINATINQALLAINTNEIYTNKYLKYVLNSYEKYALSESMGTAQNNLSAIKVLNFNVPLCSKEEMNSIVNFLNKKCTEIDSLTQDIQHQISLLEEYKKTIITEAITKGLDSNAETKDSGIEWIGKINKKFKIIQLKYFAYMKGRIGWQGLKSSDFIEDGPYCVTGTDFFNGKVNWETCYHVSEKRYSMDNKIQLKNGDLLVTKDGTIGKLALIYGLPYKACLNSHLLLIRPLKNKFLNNYLFYVLQSDVFFRYYKMVSNGTTMDSISQEKLGEFKFSMPNIKEQEEIVNYLNSKCFEIDSAINLKQQQLSKLEEYKKSLIYEYVTGKKETSYESVK